MGNSKQARYSRIGGTPHHANNYIHLDMMSAPASTIGRTYRSTFKFNMGVSPTNQNSLRYNIKTLTPEIREQFWRTGAKTKDSMKPPPEPFVDWVKFARPRTTDLSLSDAIAHISIYDSSAGVYYTHYSATSTNDFSRNVFMVVEGTPYESDAFTKRSALELKSDFCNNRLDSSFIVADQPLVLRLTFNPNTFEDPTKYHFEGVLHERHPLLPPHVPQFKVQPLLRFDDGYIAEISANHNVRLGHVLSQSVDISFGREQFSNMDLLSRFKRGNFTINPQIMQWDKRNNDRYHYNPDTVGKNNIDICNNVSSGIMIYTPPYMVTDLSLIDASVLQRSGKANQSHDVELINLKYPHLTNKKVLDSEYNTNGVHLTLNRAFPTNVVGDWIEKVQFSFKENRDVPGNWTDASNLLIGGTPGNYNELLFDICKNSISLVVTDSYFWLRTRLKIPKTCKQVVGSHESSIHFTMDLSANIKRSYKYEITSIRLMIGGAFKTIYTAPAPAPAP